MTFDDLMTKFGPGKPPRRRSRDVEHRIQCACVEWFALQYPKLAGRLFAVANGGGRSKAEAARLKAEGVVAGVSDLILLKRNREYGALLIEMKTPERQSHQSDRQVWWQQTVTADGEYKYVVCRSLTEFTQAVNDYLSNV